MCVDKDGISKDELAHWLAFDQLNIGFGTKKISRLLERFGGIIYAWESSSSDLRSMRAFSNDLIEKFLSKRKTIKPASLLADLQKTDVLAIAYGDPRYPLELRHIYQPPIVLYTRGKFQSNYFINAVAMVGTRRATSYGKSIAKKLAREFAQRAVPIISGMAYGIDSYAHWGAIEGGGKTVAVLATGPDLCYPSSNRPLYDSIVNEGNGIVLSEFFPGTKAQEWHFPARNRIVSGLSRAVVVVEAPKESGALITADIGFNQSKPIFSVPGRIDSPMSEGSNAILKDKAAPALSVEQILKDLALQTTKDEQGVPVVIELIGREKEVYEMLSYEPMHFDHLCHQSGIPAGELSAILTMLELARLVTRHEGDLYSKED